MLIRAIEVTTDRTSENVLMAVLTLREVIITQTQQIAVADKADMKEGPIRQPLSTPAQKPQSLKTNPCLALAGRGSNQLLEAADAGIRNPLTADNQQFSTILAGVTYQISITWRDPCWVLDIANSSGNRWLKVSPCDWR